MWRPDAEEGRILLAVARATLAGAGERALAGALVRDRLRRPGAAFVTLHLAGELRGCVGTLEATDPLAHTVARQALAAANDDPRFSPLGRHELQAVRLSVSVLGPITPVPSSEAIVVGLHGVCLVRATFRAVFLPQVAPEQGWDLSALLEHLALKAGLRRGDWDGASLAVFETVSFGED
jgi:AmmeMemoRadiSam system protein A